MLNWHLWLRTIWFSRWFMIFIILLISMFHSSSLIASQASTNLALKAISSFLAYETLSLKTIGKSLSIGKYSGSFYRCRNWTNIVAWTKYQTSQNHTKSSTWTIKLTAAHFSPGAPILKRICIGDRRRRWVNLINFPQNFRLAFTIKLMTSSFSNFKSC